MPTNPKLRLPGPVWAPFRGWSVLYDELPPGDDSVRALAPLRLDEAAIAANAVYAVLATWSTRLAGELGDGFAALPPSTYHVTVCDGVSQAHADGDAALRVGEVVGSLPGSIVGWRSTLADVAAEVEALLDVARQHLTLVPRGVEVRGTALVVDLAPDEESQRVAHDVDAARRALLQRLATAWELDLDVDRPWAPHVTLGYWAKPARARPGRDRLARLSEALGDALDDLSATYAGGAVYAFEDMATYWRAP